MTAPPSARGATAPGRPPGARAAPAGKASALRGWLPWLDRQGRFSGLRAAAFALTLLPAVLVLYAAWMGQLGSKPWTEAIHRVGIWAVRLLILSLAISPLRRLLDWSKLIGIRRLLGLSVMAYALGHLGLYCIDMAFDWGLIVSEIARRFYLTIGFVALLGLCALGATSTDRMIRRLGKNWQRLHNLVYPITALALLHFALQSKIDVTEPVLMSGLFVLLLLYRGLYRWKLPVSLPVLAGLALLAGLATALLESGWYALTSGVSPWLVFQANADILTYWDYASIRPAHWVALAGLAVAAAHAWRAGRARPRRRVATA
ncbi:sulfite oxidase heme-binding subunit YedZ [Bosea minatitlanensis]|uniref:Protein-methionine-sulfoxide reductase heme-binding subunit MsrQ n=1 Tax=Bosea minatitlanensis TaxID=128782 RepID=A0ABW0F8U5_9HYPH|nr:protein-methionine-sulfoxide reductase heme-binding subunit MsrQ [Bosea minatitlanensis]MCT4494611.1 sulfoxide reductase heme-binding subunit YedZ [Bosea minatitlanensis]